VTATRQAFVGIVGGDVPRQLVLASGAIPYRLTGSWEGDIDPAAQDLLGAADAPVARILTDLRAGRIACDALVVCADSQAHVRLFYALRSVAPELPLQLLDLPRAESAAAHRFARFQLERLQDFLTGVTGRPIDVAALAAAAREERGLGAALARLRDRRRAAPAQCSGAMALEAYLDAARRPPADAVARVDDAHGDVPAGAVRVHLTGSDHPDAAVYRLLEEHGCVVVSEDHGTGDAAQLGAAVDGDGVDEVLEGLIAQHFARVGTSATASSASRARLTREAAAHSRAAVVASVVREFDEAPAWDLPDQGALLAEIGVPLTVSTRVPPDGASPAARELAADIVRSAAAA
jgi:benzoyl-CoA reductase/2-hydroxyglutaryl-CoA dehydratase subunit BcrC/BadD/HgdB